MVLQILLRTIKMHRRKFPFLLKSRKRLFFFIVVAEVIAIVIVLFLSLQRNAPHQPAYGLRTRFATVEWKGRLGNLMFQYASLLGVARLHNMTAVLQPDFPLFNVFTLNSAKRSHNILNTLGAYAEFEDYGGRGSAYDSRVVKHMTPGLSLMLKGYLQSWRYFNTSSDILRKEFTFTPEIMKSAQTFLQTVHKDSIKVGIHARQGDVLEPYFSNYGYSTPGKEYYDHARDYMRQKFGDKVVFIVCSDSPDWIHANIQGSDVVYCPMNQPSAVDMAILASCQHTILSVGSFGWWAAWLANGTTVYYKHWPKPASQLEYHVNKKEYFLPSWVPME